MRRGLRPEKPETDLIAVGYLTKAHGIRGELTCVLTAETPGLEQDLPGRRVYLRPRSGGQAKPFVVASLRAHQETLLLRLEGVNDRTEAELLRSHTLFVPSSLLPPLAEDEMYVRDLPGLRVLAVPHGEPGAEGREIGRITSVDDPAGQWIWTITTPEGREILFPAVDNFILSLEPDKGLARIMPPPGLLELYLDE